MTTFQLTKTIKIECEAKKTRNGFRHEATLYIGGKWRDFAKINYLNRTWESYEYQSVIHNLIGETPYLSSRQKAHCKKKADSEPKESGFGAIAMIMKMGELLCNTQKTRNDWKTRMLKAGLDGRGLIMPDDWDSLNEDEKEARLDGVIKTLA